MNSNMESDNRHVDFFSKIEGMNLAALNALAIQIRYKIKKLELEEQATYDDEDNEYVKFWQKIDRMNIGELNILGKYLLKRFVEVREEILHLPQR